MLSKRIESAGKLSAAQRKIASFLIRHEGEIPYLTEQDIARKSGVSIATVSRFWGAIGLASLKEAKKQLQANSAIPPAAKMKDKLDRMSNDNVAAAMISMEIDHLQETMAYLSEDKFELAVELLTNAEHVYVFGTGPSKSLSELLCFRLNRFGIPMVQVAPGVNDMFEQLVRATPRDVLVVFGFFGYPADVAAAMRLAHETGVPAILVTDMVVSEIHSSARTVLYAYRGEPNEFHSMVAPVAVIDSLTVAIARKDDRNAMERLNRLYELRKRYALKGDA